jgi:ABC transporter
MNETPAILAEGLSKSFGDVHALQDVDLSVAPGSVLGLLGPNGAGKTTTMRILTTLLRPDTGHARVAGLDVVRRPAAVRRVIGLAGQAAASTSTSPAGRTWSWPAACTTLAEPSPSAMLPSCWNGSTWPRQPTAPCGPGPAACAAAWTNRRSSLPSPGP